MTSAADLAVLDAWWRAFVDTGSLPAELERVQQRLVRAVYRGELPSGPVHVKGMAFPRAKDRLRYLLRALPASHEARMLRRVAAARIPCPEVIAVRTGRRLCLAARSMLVLRTLAVSPVPATESEAQKLREAADIAARLLAAGIVHRDLHGENFLRLADGSLAVLDLQSARFVGPMVCRSSVVRVAIAARLVRDRQLPAATAESILLAAGLLRNAAEMARVLARVRRERRRFQTTRVYRCLQECTEFSRRLSCSGHEHRRRAPSEAGRWHHGGTELLRAWIGQRELQLRDGRPPSFPAFFRKWWWLGGRCALYVPAAWSDRQIEAQVKAAADGFGHFLRGEDGDDEEEL